MVLKRLKFSEPLPKLILNGKKNSTWRINDDKNILINDLLSLCYSGGREFAKAKVIFVKETNFENLTEKDKEGHEKFLSDKEMYKAYSNYYNIKVGPKTKVKIIKFNISNAF